MSRNDVVTVHRMAVGLEAGQQSPNLATIAGEDQLKALIKAVNDIQFRLDRIERHLCISTASSAAGPKLASIPELLAHILLYLPMRDLLLAQRVSRTFKEVIENSAAIQRALFLAPESRPTTLRETDVRVNPLLADMKSCVSIPIYNKKGHAFEPVFIEGAGWNTRMLRIVKCEVNTDTIGYGVPQLEMILGRLPGTACYDCVEAIGQSVHGSWRRMYLTQPPILTVWCSETHLRNLIAHPLGDPERKLGELWSWEIRRSDRMDIDADQGEL